MSSSTRGLAQQRGTETSAAASHKKLRINTTRDKSKVLGRRLEIFLFLSLLLLSCCQIPTALGASFAQLRIAEFSGLWAHWTVSDLKSNLKSFKHTGGLEGSLNYSQNKGE